MWRGLLRPLRGSGFALGQPDAFGAGESRFGYSRANGDGDRTVAGTVYAKRENRSPARGRVYGTKPSTGGTAGAARCGL